jgi:hypothetical protein
MIPTDLLKQLQEKDPETWKRAQSIRHFLKPHNSEAAVGAWLLYCIVRAVRARGWFYQVVSKGEWFLGKQISDLGVEAYVGPDPGQDLETGYADTEAEALLLAYLAAREASLEIRSGGKDE